MNVSFIIIQGNEWIAVDRRICICGVSVPR